MANAIWVRWIDSNSQQGWCGQHDIDTLRPAHILEIGFVVHEDDDCLVITPTVKGRTEDGHRPHREPIAIPKVAIYERGEIQGVPNA